MLRRRDVLTVGGLAAGGLSLPKLLAAKKRGQIAPKADACIVLFLNGGPSHLDMWDMKPDAPVDLRGEFNPIASSQPGVQVSEHLPRLARHMHRGTLVRSMKHSVNNSHAAAVYAALTGHDRGEKGGGAKPTDHPPPGAVLAKLRPTKREALPYVTLPFKTKEGANGPLQPGFLAGLMGPTWDPFWVLDDPNGANFRVRNLAPAAGMNANRLADRGRLLKSLDRRVSGDHSLDSLSDFQHQALGLLTSNSTRRAFDLGKEPAKLRDEYGRNIYGQSTLLARRLIEAGTRLVTLSWAPDANATWDTHAKNFTKLKNTLLPQFDAACSSLLADLAARGMLERTLVAVLGDFGRTPKINKNAGRDHWNACYTVMLAGGGMKEGFVFGKSDRIGARPLENPTAPADIIASMYRLLGIDPQDEIHDTLDRPYQIAPGGNFVAEIVK